MYPLLSLLAFLCALLGVIVSFINAIRKNKNPSLKLRWILLPLVLSFVSLVINRYANSVISKINENTLGSLKIELRSAKSDLSNAKASLDSLTKGQTSLILQNKLLKSSLDTTNKKLNNAEMKMLPRSFTKKQISEFDSFLENAPKGKISVTCVLGDEESHSFANQIKSLLESAGYQVDGVNQAVYTGVVPPIMLAVKSQQLAPLYAGFIQHAFDKIGINAPGQLESQQEAYTLNIVVGHK